MERILADNHPFHVAVAHLHDGMSPGRRHGRRYRPNGLGRQNGQPTAGADLRLVGFGFIFATAEAATGPATKLNAARGDADAQTELDVAIIRVERIGKFGGPCSATAASTTGP